MSIITYKIKIRLACSKINNVLLNKFIFIYNKFYPGVLFYIFPELTFKKIELNFVFFLCFPRIDLQKNSIQLFVQIEQTIDTRNTSRCNPSELKQFFVQIGTKLN